MANDIDQASGLRVPARYPIGTIVPDFPALPVKMVERFPELKTWESAIKKWQEDFTSLLKNTR